MINNFLVVPLVLPGLAIIFTLWFSRKPIPAQKTAWILAPFPLVAFVSLLWLTSKIPDNQAISSSIKWLPALNLSLSLYLDELSAMFALLISGIGTLVVVYAGYYFKGDLTSWRFFAYLFLFMAAMLGLVLAGDVVSLFIFWEITSVISFFLVAYRFEDVSARNGAFKALFITAGGGIALLCGLVWIAYLSGGTDFATILSSGEVLRQNAFYPAFFALIFFGAMTKSAQVPAHIWLPGAMSAPTPASAYLHSATMVKAGIYLLARLNPALGFTELWFYLLTITGLVTMLTGAYLGLKQNDLKALLAYSTISQLGVMMAMIGQDIAIAFKALVISVVAHALYKSSLFLVVGIVDHETGSRDLRQLGGLKRTMPITAVITGIAALSMAGLPPMFGFLAKETLLDTSLHPSLPPLIGSLFPWMTVLAGAMLLTQAGILFYDTFLGKPSDPDKPLKGHDPSPGMWLAPAIPAVLSLAVGLLPEPERLASFLASAAEIAFGDTVKVSLAIWTGLSVPLVLSFFAIGIGTALFLVRNRTKPLLQSFIPSFSFNILYARLLTGIDKAAGYVVNFQKGLLRSYLVTILTATGILILVFSAIPWIYLGERLSGPVSPGSAGIFPELRVFILLLAALSALVSVILRRDIYAILALSVSGLAIAIWIALEPAPDVALVQIVVDLLATVILVLSLSRIPHKQREKAHEFTFQQSRPGLFRDALISLGAGLVVAIFVYISLSSRPHEDIIPRFYAENAKLLTNAKDIVGAILVDFRGFDTFFEIIVFATAGLGIHSLLHYATRKAGDKELPDPVPMAPEQHPVTGIGGIPTSPLLRFFASVLFPLALLLSAVQMMYGHDQPGDGFTAGVFTSLTIGLWYVVFGYHATKQQLPWLRPGYLIAGGMLVALINSLAAALFGSFFFSPVDYGKLINLPLPAGFNLSSSFFFEVAIFLAVLGGATYILDNLGRPKEMDQESDVLLRQFETEDTSKSGGDS